MPVTLAGLLRAAPDAGVNGQPDEVHRHAGKGQRQKPANLSRQVAVRETKRAHRDVVPLTLAPAGS